MYLSNVWLCLSILAEAYFSTVASEVKAAFPKKLYLGCKFAGYPSHAIGVQRMAAKYGDAVSIDLYGYVPFLDSFIIENISQKLLLKLLAERKALLCMCIRRYTASDTLPKNLDVPVILSEFHVGAMDVGLLSPGLHLASNQAQRARVYEMYMRTALNLSRVIGAHWFQYR